MLWFVVSSEHAEERHILIMKTKTSFSSRLLYIYFLASILFIAFLSGWVVKKKEVFPSYTIQAAFEYLRLHLFSREKRLEIKRILGLNDPDFLAKLNDGFTITNHTKETAPIKSFEHFLLLKTVEDPGVALYDAPNSRRFEWDLSKLEHIEGWRGSGYMAYALFRDGRLLVGSHGGTKLALINKTGDVIWELNEPIHHWPSLDGNYVYIPSRENVALPNDKISDKYEGRPFSACRENSVLLDNVLVVELASGNVVERIDILDALSKHGEYSSKVVNCKDPLHLNDVRVITSEQAALFPAAKRGDLLVSSRHLNENGAIFLLDRSTKRIKWFVDSFFKLQHSPRITSRGSVLVFDNHGARVKNGIGHEKNSGQFGFSRIVEISLSDKRIVGIYGGTERHYFFSDIAGRLQVLNDRIFVQSFAQGEIFELRCPKQKPISSDCRAEFLYSGLSTSAKETKDAGKFNQHKLLIKKIFLGDFYNKADLEFLR